MKEKSAREWDTLLADIEESLISAQGTAESFAAALECLDEARAGLSRTPYEIAPVHVKLQEGLAESSEATALAAKLRSDGFDHPDLAAREVLLHHALTAIAETRFELRGGGASHAGCLDGMHPFSVLSF